MNQMVIDESCSVWVKKSEVDESSWKRDAQVYIYLTPNKGRRCLTSIIIFNIYCSRLAITGHARRERQTDKRAEFSFSVIGFRLKILIVVST